VAANAFSRVVALDPEYGDAWNNLAAAHLHLKQKKQAFLALEEASKHKHDSWRMWENYLATAMVSHDTHLITYPDDAYHYYFHINMIRILVKFKRPC
jgi:predicted Zn-dependent protease